MSTSSASALFKKAEAAAVTSEPLHTMTNQDAEQCDLQQVIRRLHVRLQENEQERSDIAMSLSRHPLVRERTTTMEDTGSSDSSNDSSSKTRVSTMDIVPAFQTAFRELLQTSFQTSSSSLSSSSSSSSTPSTATTTTPASAAGEKTNNTRLSSSNINVTVTVQQLAAKLEGASVLADRVSAQVRALDEQRLRVSAALASTTDVLHLRSCAANVERALANDDVRGAAIQVARFRRAVRGPVAEVRRRRIGARRRGRRG